MRRMGAADARRKNGPSAAHETQENQALREARQMRRMIRQKNFFWQSSSPCPPIYVLYYSFSLSICRICRKECKSLQSRKNFRGRWKRFVCRASAVSAAGGGAC